MHQHDLELSDFTEPFGPRYTCALSYTDEAWVKACAEDAENPEIRAEMLACPLCNTEHPEHEHAIRHASAHLN